MNSLPQVTFGDGLSVNVAAPSGSSLIPLNDIYTGSSIQTQIHSAVKVGKMDAVENIVNDLLKKNEELLAMNDAMGYKPNSRKSRATHDVHVKKSSRPAFPTTGKKTSFPVSQNLQGHISHPNCGEKHLLDHSKLKMMRPKSPTRKSEFAFKDQTNFSTALMESSLGDPDIEQIFKVQDHELVCGIKGKSLMSNKENKVLASLDFGYFWCNFCSFMCNSKTLLIQHISEHRFSCKHCPYESFCRSDVLRHMGKMHSEFSDAAESFSYCTILADYLRVKSRVEDLDKNASKNPDNDSDEVLPSMDGDSDQSKSRKRKNDDEDQNLENCSSPPKLAKSNLSCHVQDKTLAKINQQVQLRQKQSKKQLPSVRDFEVFDMGVEEISGPYSSPGDVDTEDNNLAVSKQKPDKNPITSPKLKVSDTCKNNKQSFHSKNSTLNIYLSCAYCSFQCLNETSMKEHCIKSHVGKKPRFVTLRKIIDSGEENDVSNPDIASSTIVGSSSSIINPNYSSHDKSSNCAKSKCVVLPGSERSHSEKKKKTETLMFRCYHCPYSARRSSSMKTHISYTHQGKGLVAINDESQKRVWIFFCARDDCSFKSNSGSSFLQHVHQCTPWNQ